jgi:hypothetical protein
MRAQCLDQAERPAQGLAVGLALGDLRADVQVDAGQLDVPELPPGAVVHLERAGQRDAELALGEARRDVGVRVRVDVRVDPEVGHHAPPKPARDGVEFLGLRPGLDVEHLDPRAHSERQLGLGLAHAREDDPAHGGAGLLDPEQLAPREDVEAAALARQRGHDGQVRVRLDGVVDLVIDAVEGLGQATVVMEHRAQAVDVAGRAEPIGDGAERHALAVQDAAPVVEEVHTAPLDPSMTT